MNTCAAGVVDVWHQSEIVSEVPAAMFELDNVVYDAVGDDLTLQLDYPPEIDAWRPRHSNRNAPEKPIQPRRAHNGSQPDP